jgi:hypothetical protein
MLIAMLIAGWLGSSLVTAEEAKPGQAPKKARIQIALLLDTSSSMDGLIEQAKTQLWKIVNELATAQRGGQRPEIQVALYQYGTPSLGAATGYIRQLAEFTGDLDKVSEALFALRTNGGDEYCGAVIKAAVTQLQWSDGKDYKAIFIAGNEPFTQGQVDYKAACKEAITKGIVVNTIFCGGAEEGIQTSWKDGADLADGAYMSINQNQAIVRIAAPQDKELLELNAKLNKTYLAYGAEGARNLGRQAAQDKLAAEAAADVAVTRVQAKAGGVYRNEGWDLVDATQTGKVKLEEVKEAELPEEMKKMTPEQQKAFVAEKGKERTAIQEQIVKLGKERDAYILAEQKKQSQPGATNTLDNAILGAIRGQAQKADLQFAP